jgi:hypothetical protein
LAAAIQWLHREWRRLGGSAIAWSGLILVVSAVNPTAGAVLLVTVALVAIMNARWRRAPECRRRLKTDPPSAESVQRVTLRADPRVHFRRGVSDRIGLEVTTAADHTWALGLCARRLPPEGAGLARRRRFY